MVDGLAPTPGPWTAVPAIGDLVMVMANRMAIAAVTGDAAEPNAALICAAPEMATAVRAGDLSSARRALTERGL